MRLKWTPRTGPPAKRDKREVEATGEGDVSRVKCRVAVLVARAAVAEYAEFKGNVAFVGTQAFYRPKEVSPSAQGYHWNSNAETYFLIGDGLGRAMLKLCGK